MSALAVPCFADAYGCADLIRGYPIERVSVNGVAFRQRFAPPPKGNLGRWRIPKRGRRYWYWTSPHMLVSSPRTRRARAVENLVDYFRVMAEPIMHLTMRGDKGERQHTIERGQMESSGGRGVPLPAEWAEDSNVDALYVGLQNATDNELTVNLDYITLNIQEQPR